MLNDMDCHGLPPLPVDALKSRVSELQPPIVDGAPIETAGIFGLEGAVTETVSLAMKIHLSHSAGEDVHFAFILPDNSIVSPTASAATPEMVTFDESVQVHFADEAPVNVNKLVQVKLFVYLPLFVEESKATVM